MAPSAQRAQGLVDEAVDLAGDLREYLEVVQPDPLRLDEVEERLTLIRDLHRKYGEDSERHAEQAGRELETLEVATGRLESLAMEEARLADELTKLGGGLTDARQQAAERLSAEINAGLVELAMEGAKFKVSIVSAHEPGEFGPIGFDEVEFQVAPNPGEGFKPLAKIASGGETSRLMLGLKSALAIADRRPSLIFDEIDQGIGGRIGTVVGHKLHSLSQEHQVLCVTHLPQIAAWADRHLHVEKRVEAGRTVTQAHQLEAEQRVTELAEMLGEASSENLRSAEALLMKVGQPEPAQDF